MTENELCQEHQENLCIAVLSIIPLRKTFVFFTKITFIQGAFKNMYSRISVENPRTFQGFPTIFQFSRTYQARCSFKDFSRPVRTMNGQ